MSGLDDFETELNNVQVEFDAGEAVRTLQDAAALIADLDRAGSIKWRMSQAERALGICRRAQSIAKQYGDSVLAAPRTWAPPAPGTPAPSPWDSASTAELPQTVVSVQFTDPEEQDPEAAGDVAPVHVDIQGT